MVLAPAEQRQMRGRRGVLRQKDRDAAEQTKSGRTVEMQTMEHAFFDLVNAHANPRARARLDDYGRGLLAETGALSAQGCSGDRWRSAAPSPVQLSGVFRVIPAVLAILPAPRHQQGINLKQSEVIR